MEKLSCPEPSELSAYVSGRIDEATSEIFESHFSTCINCQTLLARTRPDDDTFVASIKAGFSQSEFDDEPALLQVIEDLRRQQFRATRSNENEIGNVSLTVDSAPAPEGIERTLGPYRILKTLGAGGMGQVYLAEHTRLEMVVALKLLPEHLTHDPVAIARFDREMKAVGRFNHPNLVRATDAGEFQGQHYLAMEFVDGHDLAHIVHSNGPMKIEDACEVIRQACVGIQHAHEHGMIHRDLKPSNLMIAKNGTVKVLDLGLARLQTKTGAGLTSDFQIMGTADYMAPEQALKALQVDSRVDIYSLGCTLYALLCGRPPFADEKHSTSLRKLMAHEQEQPIKLHERRSDVPIELSDVVDKAMAKSPVDRFASASELAAALSTFAEGATLASLYGTTASTQSNTSLPQNTSSVSKYVALTDTAVSPKPTLDASQSPAKKFTHAGWLAPVLLIAIGVLALAAFVLTFNTSQGTIIVEVDAGQIETSIDGERLVVEDTKSGAIYHLSIQGNKIEKQLSPGDYKIRVENKTSGLELDTDEFRLSRDGTMIVKAFVKPVPPVKTEPMPMDSSPPDSRTLDRRVAESMIAHGAIVHMKVSGGYVAASTIESLPTEEFRISRVEFRSAYELTDDDFESLTALKELAALDLCEVAITERVINYLIRIRSLNLLWLKYDTGPVTGLERITRLPTPYNLKLQGAAVGDAEIKAMSQLVRVRFLSLNGQGFTDECIADIVKISEIAELSIDNSRVTGRELKLLAGLPRLETLQLPYSLVSDVHVKDLAEIKGLKRLNLSHSKITDRSANVLENLTTLQHLNIGSNLTEVAVRNLRTKMPNCRIEASH